MNPNSEHHHYFLTINNYTEDDMLELQTVLAKKSVDYYCWGFEGYPCLHHHPHIHASIHFKSSVKWSTMKNAFKRARIEVCKNPYKAHMYIRGYELLRGEYHIKCEDCACDLEYEGSHTHGQWVQNNIYFTEGEIPCNGKKKTPPAVTKVIEAINEGKTIAELDELFPAYMITNKHKVIKWIQDHKPPHTRKLVFLHEDKRFDYPPNASVVFFEDDKIDIYNGEKSCVFNCADDPWNKIVCWLKGFPPSFRRGFELIKFDPEHIVILYKTPENLSYLRKKYKSYI